MTKNELDYDGRLIIQPDGGVELTFHCVGDPDMLPHLKEVLGKALAPPASSSPAAAAVPGGAPSTSPGG